MSMLLQEAAAVSPMAEGCWNTVLSPRGTLQGEENWMVLNESGMNQQLLKTWAVYAGHSR